MSLVSIRAANLRDACFIAAHMRQADHDEIAAVFRFDNRAQVAAALLAMSPGLAFVAYLNGAPVTCFGVSHVSETVCSGWAYGTARITRTIPAVSRYALRKIGAELIRRGYRRIEVRTDVNHDLSRRWLEGLGFVHEGVLRSYGFNGEDFAMYSIIEKDAADVLRGRIKGPAAAASGAGLAAAADARG